MEGRGSHLGIERAWLERVIEQAPEPLVLIDQAANRMLLNGAACSLLGWSANGATSPGDAWRRIDLERPDGNALAPDDSPLRRALECGESVAQRELVVRRSDGSRVPVLMSAAPVNATSGLRTGAVAVFQDLTMLKELERLREQWMAVVAHDLRQPIAVMSICLEDLGDVLGARLPPEDAVLLKRLRSQLGRLNGMIDDLLDFAQIEAGHLKLHPRPLDLAAEVSEVVKTMSATFKDRTIRIESRGALPPVTADPGRVEQALTNLLVNAQKYGTPDTEIVVELDGDAAGARVAVVNQGHGIEAAELPHVFERFYRAHGAAERRVKGLGLGLFIVRGIVNAHGGRVFAESTPGERTRIGFTLPAAPAPPAA